MRLRASEFLICGCGVLLVALTAFGLTLSKPVIGQFGIGYGVALDRFVALGCLQGLLYFAAVFLILRTQTPARMRTQTPARMRTQTPARMLWAVLGIALLMRLLALAVPPFLSNDLYRYIWDGWVQAAGVNPYRYIPADSHLAFLRDAVVYPNINRADYAHTIYPPAAEMVYFVIMRLVALLALPPVLGIKLAMLGLEVVGIWAMLRLLDLAGLPRARIAIYAWNPVPIWEFAGNGHVDAIAVCFIALALLAVCRRRSGLSAAALGIAVLAKFLPVVLLPALWRRWDWKFAGVFAAVIILLYVPYLGVGTGVFGFLGGYGAEEGIDSGQGVFALGVLGHFIPLSVNAARFYLLLLAGLLAAIGLCMVFGGDENLGPADFTRRVCRRSLLLGCVLLVGLSPHYPWYFCWLLIPGCVAGSASAIYLVAGSLLLYLNPIHTNVLWPAVLYGPFLILVIWDVVWRRPANASIILKFAEGDGI